MVFTWYLTMNKIPVEFEKRGFASNLLGVMTSDRPKIEKQMVSAQ